MRASKPSVCQLFCILLLGWLSFVNTLHAREVKVGVYANAPKVMLGADGQPSGIFGDLLREIAAKEDWTLVPVVCEWQACLDATRAGQIDLMTDVAYSEARAQIFSFHQTPAINSWSQVYQRTGLSIQSMLDLQNRRVAILQGSVQQDYFSGLLSSFGVQPIWVPVNSLAEGFTKVSAGEADVVVSNHQFGSLQAPRYMLVETPIMFQPSRLFYATGKGRNADLLAALDQHLNVWRDDPNSVYFDVLKRWGGEPPRTLVPRAFWWILFALGTLLLLAIVFVSLLRRQVREKTRHLLQSEDKLSTILNSVESYIYIKDPQLRYQYTNSIFSASVGRPLVGLADTDLFNAATAEQLQRNDRRVLEHGERVADEKQSPRRTANIHTYLSVKLPLRRPDGSIYALCGISTDITELKRSREAIHQLAFYDALTGLPNRRLLMDRMQQILAARDRTAHDGALLFIDLDHFKTLNDTLGHDVGDLLLQQVTKRLKECTRDQDTLARLGGDEFVVMLQDLSTDANDAARQADAVAGKIVSTLAEPYMLAGQHYQSTVSAHCYAGPSAPRKSCSTGRPGHVLVKADGRNTAFFNPDMQARMCTQALADLREAQSARSFTPAPGRQTTAKPRPQVARSATRTG
jgi:diguanylate cyclase (GGDEF)-like protein